MLGLQEDDEELLPETLALTWTFHTLNQGPWPWTHCLHLARYWDGHENHCLQQLHYTYPMVHIGFVSKSNWSSDYIAHVMIIDCPSPAMTVLEILLHQESCPKNMQESSSSKSEGSNLWTQYDNTTYWYSEFKDAHLGKNVACRRCLFAIATTASRMKSRLSAAVRHGTWLMAISNWPPPDSECICQMYPKKVSTLQPLQCSKPDISIWPWFYDYALVFWDALVWDNWNKFRNLEGRKFCRPHEQ